jgi:hypothetical protein
MLDFITHYLLVLASAKTYNYYLNPKKIRSKLVHQFPMVS